MTPSLRRLLAQATRWTANGELRRATSAIRAALAGGGLAPATDPDAPPPVIIVPPPLQPAQREAPMPPPGQGGRFIAAAHTGPSGTREYKLYIPPAAPPGPRPLVVMLHGCTQDPDDFAAGTAMNAAAAAAGLYVAYPAQSRGANPGRCWNWFKHSHQQRGRGEPALIAGIAEEVIARHPIDRRRVYVAGMSAGGAMAAIMAEAYPDLFAAVGVHSGLPAGSARDVESAFAAMREGAARSRRPGGPRPTIVFHGDRDATVHPANGDRLVDAHGERHARSDERAGGGRRPATRSLYRDGEGRVVAEHWRVHGAGHAWSGGRPEGSYTDPAGPDATAEMLRFFLERRNDG